ncbi:MAG: type II secretion system inner membrane protein GspF [Polyangia bacterium]|jgi:general secretion pathway protein F|nr:type II secretion system inner membrane protein GspF [Polyangia bacterium]
MPVFAYKGIGAAGKEVTGIKDADTAKALRTMLRRDGVFLTEFKEAKAGKAAEAEQEGKGLSREVHLFGSGISKRQVAIFTRQLAVLLRSGIPLAEGLSTLTEQSAHQGRRSSGDRLQRVLGDVRRQVNEGSSLADALGNHPTVFHELYLNMIRSGEAAGNLEEVLDRLADFMDRDLDLRGKVSGALLYPAIMSVVSVLILGILMVVVVPKITQIFDDMERTLPWNTRFLISVSGFMGRRWWVVILGTGLLGTLFYLWKRSPGGRAIWDRMLLSMPIIGGIIRHMAISRFSRTLGTMFQSGVPLLRALDISKYVLTNTQLQEVITKAETGIREGESIAAQLKKSKYFEPMVVHMVAVGERSGQLPEMLRNVAEAYEKQVESRLAKLTVMLEPLMIIVMGGTVGFVIFSIIIPILQMNEVVQ